jgi:hypothetical protein
MNHSARAQPSQNRCEFNFRRQAVFHMLHPTQKSGGVGKIPIQGFRGPDYGMRRVSCRERHFGTREFSLITHYRLA